MQLELAQKLRDLAIKVDPGLDVEATPLRRGEYAAIVTDSGRVVYGNSNYGRVRAFLLTGA